MKQELWKSIPLSNGIYEVSNYGNVRRAVGGQGAVAGKLLTTWRRKDGYIQVSLRINHKQKNYLVHRLVAQAFIRLARDAEEVNHKDLNRQNNILSNLEYLTRQQNLFHAERLGVNVFNSKLTPVKVRSIRQLYIQGWRRSDLARQFGVSWNQINRIVTGQRWGRVA